MLRLHFLERHSFLEMENNLIEWIYAHNDDNTVRYILGKPGDKNLICFGVNPSTATPEKLDPTLTNVEKFAKNLGYDGWIMFNLYPLRSTDPDNLPQEMDRKEHEKNLTYIGNFLKAYKNCDCWAAWGTLIEKRPYLKECLRDILDRIGKVNWISIGNISKKGHPHHPLYVKLNTLQESFDIQKYFATL